MPGGPQGAGEHEVIRKYGGTFRTHSRRHDLNGAGERVDAQSDKDRRTCKYVCMSADHFRAKALPPRIRSRASAVSTAWAPPVNGPA